jgi:hypothetical protein
MRITAAGHVLMVSEAPGIAKDHAKCVVALLKEVSPMRSNVLPCPPYPWHPTTVCPDTLWRVRVQVNGNSPAGRFSRRSERKVSGDVRRAAPVKKGRWKAVMPQEHRVTEVSAMSDVTSNLERFKKDRKHLITKGEQLRLAMQAECFGEEFVGALKRQKVADIERFLKEFPSFKGAYQSWYSEAKAVVKQVLPDRLSDFVAHFQKPKARKNITYESYRIEDYLQGLSITRGYEKQKIVGPDAAIPQFEQQLAILTSAEARFETSLYDIRQVVQADLFDSDLDAAEELAKKRFTRSSGAMAGVVLEKHLAQVCENHEIKVSKKHPTISDLNDALKAADAIDVAQWRFVQHLGDIRNLCDHSKGAEPNS